MPTATMPPTTSAAMSFNQMGKHPVMRCTVRPCLEDAFQDVIISSLVEFDIVGR